MTVPAVDPNVAAVLLDCVRQVVADVRSSDRAARATLDSSFERDLELGSLELVELFMLLEESLGVRLPTSVLSAVDTPRDLLDAVRRAIGRREKPPVARTMRPVLRHTVAAPVEGSPARADTATSASGNVGCAERSRSFPKMRLMHAGM